MDTPVRFRLHAIHEYMGTPHDIVEPCIHTNAYCRGRLTVALVLFPLIARKHEKPATVWYQQKYNVNQ